MRCWKTVTKESGRTCESLMDILSCEASMSTALPVQMDCTQSPAGTLEVRVNEGHTFLNQRMRSAAGSSSALRTFRCNRSPTGTDTAVSLGSAGFALCRIFMTASCRCCASFLGFVEAAGRDGPLVVAALEGPKCLDSRDFAAAFFSSVDSEGSGGVHECALGSLCLCIDRTL